MLAPGLTSSRRLERNASRCFAAPNKFDHSAVRPCDDIMAADPDSTADPVAPTAVPSCENTWGTDNSGPYSNHATSDVHESDEDVHDLPSESDSDDDDWLPEWAEDDEPPRSPSRQALAPLPDSTDDHPNTHDQHTHASDQEDNTPCTGMMFDDLQAASTDLRNWATSQGFILCQTSGSEKTGGITLQCDLGRKARRGESKANVPLDKRRQGSSRRFDNKEDLCPCVINVRRVVSNKEVTGYRITSLNLEHNHDMHDKPTVSYLNRGRDRAGDLSKMVMDLSKSGIKAMQILRQCQLKFPSVSITLRDIWNIGAKLGVNLSDDAQQMVDSLREHKAKEPRWFYATKKAPDGTLQSVFWMSPGQVEAAQR